MITKKKKIKIKKKDKKTKNRKKLPTEDKVNDNSDSKNIKKINNLLL